MIKPVVCDYMLELGGGRSTKNLKKAMTVSIANAIMRKCGVKVNGMNLKLSKLIGEGSYGKVYGDPSGKMAVKFQIFPLERTSEMTSEIELTQLFSRNGISPKSYGFGFFKTNDYNFGGSYIIMEKLEPFDKVLKSSSAAQKREIMAKIEPQMVKHLNKMLSLGFACIDLKPSNALYDKKNSKIYLIDWTSELCARSPALINLKKVRERTNVITFKSLLPSLIRRDVIALQLIFFHVTCKIFGRAYFGEKLLEGIVFGRDQLPIRSAYKLLVLGVVPRVYRNFLEDKVANLQLYTFLSKIARIGKLNFMHYSQLGEGSSFERFVSLVLGVIKK
jgi:hypothetical protein